MGPPGQVLPCLKTEVAPETSAFLKNLTDKAQRKVEAITLVIVYSLVSTLGDAGLAVVLLSPVHCGPFRCFTCEFRMTSQI